MRIFLQILRILRFFYSFLSLTQRFTPEFSREFGVIAAIYENLVVTYENLAVHF